MKQTINDIKRLKDLLSYGILDTPKDASFDNLAQLVSIICNTPVALISFLDDRRQWYKAKVGITETEMPYQETICQYTLLEEELLEIPNTLFDERLKENPNVHVENGVRFYIGLPLKSKNGYAIGTVCAADIKPRKLNDDQIKALKIIADQTMHLLEITKRNENLASEVKNVLEGKINQAKQQIKQTENAYNRLFKAIGKSNAIVEFSPEGKILSTNKVFENIIGYSETELVGKHHNVLLDKDDKVTNPTFWKSLKEGKFKSGRFKRLHKNGSTIWIQASYNPVLDSENKVIRVTKIAQNITLEISSQQALEKAKKQADELNIQKDHFIANISHEIRTPINSILGFTDLLLDQETNTEKSNYLKAVKTSGDNLLHLVNDILDLSKIEAGIFQVEKKAFPLHETIDTIFSILSVKALQKKLSFTYTINKNLPDYIIGDKNRLTQILINLLGNAIKFTPSGKVTLKITTENSKLITFTVSDTGIGIPEDKLSTIFERFSQAQEDTSRKYGGTGLGLNIAKQLIEKQGGTIYVKSKLNKGSQFIVNLPLEASKPIKTSTQKNTNTGNERKTFGNILMCEDNEMNQNLVRAIFNATTHDLDIAQNGIEGLDLLAKKDYDLILMDLQMPELDGYQTTETIRNKLKLDIPIIAITANSTLKELEMCFSNGMNDYISKPFKKEELLDKIDIWLNKNLAIIKQFQTRNPIKNTLISLEHLKEMSAGDDAFLKEMLSLFQEQSKKNIVFLNSFYKENKYTSINKIAHKLKSSFSIIGGNLDILDAIENNFGENFNPKKLYQDIKSLENQVKNLNAEIVKIIKKV